MTRIAPVWDAILADKRQDDGWLVRRIFPEAPIPIFAAVQQPESKRALLIEVAAQAVGPVAEYPSARGFEVFPENVKPGPRGLVRLCLVLSDPRHRDLFEIVADDLAARVAAASAASEAVDTLLIRLRVWQAFFVHHADGLSLEEQIGLFGELSVLRWLLATGTACDTLLAAWHGPAGSIRDYCFPRCHIEVKTTTAPEAFHVSSLEQLDDGSPQALVIAFHELVDNPDGESLITLVHSIRKIVAESGRPALDLFEERLVQYGYSDAHSADYTHRRWKLRKQLFFRVQGEFPRIRRDEIRFGIRDVRYRVGVSACLEFQISAQDVLALIGADR